MRRSSLSRRVIPLLSSLLLAFALSHGASAADKALTMGKYPTLKIGFTSAHFLKFYPVSLGNVKTLIHRGKIALAQKMRDREHDAILRQTQNDKRKGGAVRAMLLV